MAVFYGFQQTFSDRKDTTDGTSTTGRVITTSTYRMPDHILLSEQKDTYALRPTLSGFSGTSLQLVTSDVKECDWEQSVYGPNGALNQPKEKSEITKSYGFKNTTSDDPSFVGTWQQIAETRTAFAYDSFTGKLILQVSSRLTLQQNPNTGKWGLFPDTTHTKTLTDHSDSGGGWVGITGYNTVWSLVSSGVLTTDPNKADLSVSPVQAYDFALAAGRRPGGVTSGGG